MAWSREEAQVSGETLFGILQKEFILLCNFVLVGFEERRICLFITPIDLDSAFFGN